MFSMPGNSYSGSLPPLTQEEIGIENQLRAHIGYLAGDIGERNVQHYPKLQAAAEYIEEVFKKLGYSVSDQIFQVDQFSVKNIIAQRQGTSHPEEIMVIGAHYDSAIGAPGADDNASGVATLLELARLLENTALERTIHFVAFVNEEPPFFDSKSMGSDQYARNAKLKHENIVAMLCIESVGYYSDQKNSQRYPFPFSFFYPSTANFIGFIGNLSSHKLAHAAIGSFRKHTQFPSEGISAPSWFIGIGWSDQLAFWKQGYPAIMITGTALFRNPNYHKNTDTPETIDYSKTARVVNGLTYVIKDLANQSIA